MNAIDRQLDRVMRARADAARQAAVRERARAERVHAAALRRRRRVRLASDAEGMLVTISAPTEGVLLLRILGSTVVVLAMALFAFEGYSPAALLAVGVLGLVVAASFVPRPYRIRITDEAFAVLGRRADRVRYVAPVSELWMRVCYGNLVFSTDRRIEFYGIRHPDDLAVVQRVQAKLDALRRAR